MNDGVYNATKKTTNEIVTVTVKHSDSWGFQWVYPWHNGEAQEWPSWYLDKFLELYDIVAPAFLRQ